MATGPLWIYGGGGSLLFSVFDSDWGAVTLIPAQHFTGTRETLIPILLKQSLCSVSTGEFELALKYQLA